MNKIFLSLITAFMLFATNVGSQTLNIPTTTNVGSQAFNLPIAATDGLLAAKVNPAALSFGNADGLGFMQRYTEDKYLRQNSLIANFRFVGYIYERLEGASYHQLNISINPVRNLYLGASADWNNSTGNTGFSALYRPWDFLSLASVNTFSNDNSDLNIYKQGIALRPLALFNEGNGYKLELTLDTYYTKQLNLDGKETKFAKPIIGLQAEPFDGIRMGVAYNSESEGIMANIGFSLGDGFGGTLLGFDKDNNFTSGTDYEHFSSEDFKTFEWMPDKEKWYELKLDRPIVDKNEIIKIGPFNINSGETVQLAQVVKKLKDIGEDKKIDGVLVKADGLSASFANYLELETAFNELKVKGKKLIFYYTHIGNVNYAFASSVADEIYLNPNGGVYMAGMTIQQPYINELLDTLGIEVVNFRSHDYKSAGNFLSEKAMTDAEKEVFNALLDGMMDEYKRMVMAGRGDKITMDFDALIDGGPYITPDRALELNLVDKLVYEEDLKETLEANGGEVAFVKKYYHSKRKYSWSEEPSKKIALIYAQGNIHEGQSTPGASIGSKTFTRAIKQAREDKSIGGIILRVNSGGGSAVASDDIAHQMEKSTEGENKKPVVASFGALAGSGGYYIGAYADHIVAQPVSLTGSIGVLGLVVNTEKLLDKIHINVDGVKKGEHADMGSWARPLSEEEKVKIRDAIAWYYQRFANVVANGRRMDIEAVEKVAQGRIWTGKEALDAGLVDELGGMNETYIWMKKELNTNKLIIQEFDGQNEKVAVDIEANLPWVKTEVPFVPLNMVKLYTEYRKLFENSTEVAYFLTPIMMDMTMK